MTPEERLARIEAVLAEEAEQPRRLWYLSFASDGEWLGAVVVEAHGIVGAARLAGELGINPGGQVVGIPVPAGREDHLPKNRLLSADDIPGGVAGITGDPPS